MDEGPSAPALRVSPASRTAETSDRPSIERAMETQQIAVLILAGLACICDLRTRRIPNALTFGGAALGTLYWLVAAGPAGCLTSLGGWATGVALFFPIVAVGGHARGDVK